MRGALLDRDGVLLLLDEEALYKKALELAAHGVGLEKALATLVRAMREIHEAVRGLKVRTLEEEAFWEALVAKTARALSHSPQFNQKTNGAGTRPAPGKTPISEHGELGHGDHV